jgi:diguanylate cyclase (GGDEF)-like protein
MSLERRHTPQLPQTAEGPWWRISHTVVYPLIGAGLGLLTPVGAFLLRFLQADPVLKMLWARSELSYNMVFYVYMLVGATITLILFGYVVGIMSESQRVHNLSLRDRVEDLHLASVTDGLTGAYSHGYLQETVALELESAMRRGAPLSVLMLDLDDFKKINDTQGHLFGDRVLKELTETVNMNIRDGDVLGRYGGEEFMVVMPGANADVAKTVADRICKSIARAHIGEADEDRVRATVSIGVATYTGEGKLDPLRLVDEADKKLYEAKHSGKNQVIV